MCFVFYVFICLGVHLIKEMCNAKVTGDFMGSTEIEFLPGNLTGGKYYADTKTAGYFCVSYFFHYSILLIIHNLIVYLEV